MLKVGLTGNVAAGKSTVARIWRSLDATVVDADVLARQAVEPGTPALARIEEEWGDKVVEAGGGLDRAALRRIVFADPSARERLEAIVHPAVAELREEAYRAAEERGERVVVADILLLFEAVLVDDLDWLVRLVASE